MVEFQFTIRTVMEEVVVAVRREAQTILQLMDRVVLSQMEAMGVVVVVLVVLPVQVFSTLVVLITTVVVVVVGVVTTVVVLDAMVVVITTLIKTAAVAGVAHILETAPVANKPAVAQMVSQTVRMLPQVITQDQE